MGLTWQGREPIEISGGFALGKDQSLNSCQRIKLTVIKSHHISLVAGARPNFMKVAPVYHALAARKEADRAKGIDLRVSVVHTGQHYDENMSDGFFRDLGIP